MSAFDAKSVPLAGLNLIEASAGTGKTYTLAELYLRLILEKDLAVSQILVVTYTRAATEELRDRLRQKLVDARDALLSPAYQRDMLADIVDAEAIRTASYKLISAIQSFDEAAIFTIHGFCQRVLADFAFESGLRFELELIGDDLDLLQSATDDFWRREVMMADKDLVEYLLTKNETPETLLRSIRNLVGKPYVQNLPVLKMDALRCSEQLEAQFSHVKLIWENEQLAVITTLNDKKVLKAKNYRADWVKNWLLMLEDLLKQPTMPKKLFEQFDRFTPDRLHLALHDGQSLPSLCFWAECELLIEHHQQLQQARALQLQQLRVNLLEFLRESLPEQKLQQQVQSYDDLLINLDQALNGQRGDWLVEELRKQYQAALIDEFQDTDPVQYASFRRIYADSGLPTFLVGDPKQAIYSFRGADIFTYLKAKSRANKEYTLETNWRSHPDLVSAVNGLFKRHANPFIYKDIPFHAVGASRDQTPALDVKNSDPAALQILWAGDTAKPMSKADLTAMSATVTADEIAQLLNRSYVGDAMLFDEKIKQTRQLTGGDIAVLVRNHRQANAVQQCLQQRGVNSVQQGRDNVFTSGEALLLERVLRAVSEPNNEQRVIAALATQLWNFNASELYQLKDDEAQWNVQLDFFYDLHQVWLKHGFMRVFRQLLVSVAAQQRLLSLADGERKLTNLNHLAELIQAQFRHQNDSIEAILHWLKTHIQSAESNDEAAQLRLESDEQLVKIITIHKSKGLEYPIVFCPFLWDANLRSADDAVISFHKDDESKQACAAFSEPELSHASAGVIVEERAEDLRLLYVALTRARERCVLIWGCAKGQKDGKHVNNSALFSLLHPTLNAMDSPSMFADLREWADTSAGKVSLRTIIEQDVVHYDAASDKGHALTPRTFAGHIQRPWRIGSFSALTKGHDAELPDYDAQTSPEALTVQPVVRSISDRFSFPRGAQAGTCLHALFEYWDFNSQDDEAMQKLVTRTLLQFGFDEKWVTVACQWLGEVLATPLADDGLHLGQLTQGQRLDELAFYFPVVDLSVAKLKRNLLPLLADNSPLRAVINRLKFYDLTGFMKGFIDLVFEHEGRFYIVDYKSNHLGNDEADYQSEQLDNAMIAHDYPLQYLIYSLALHRYLQLRIADYDPEHHLGGVYYLFIRGMKSDWKGAGIFYDKPDIELLDGLDRCLQGVSDE
ncbi:MAG: exodeoxyribonuclease V subunit beta [Pseudomonadota bacterium]|nr:exodeoxyribonuclease V subunit beta [Pseudomonadota bacterium]